MRAISLKQPYANLVASGRKTIETRTWTTKHRGDLLICASTTGKGSPAGVALCVVELYDVRPMKTHDAQAACVEHYEGAHAWLIRNLRPVKPFRVKGQLGLFNVDLPTDY